MKKAKYIIAVFVVSAAMAILAVRAFWNFGYTSLDPRQREFVKRAGFLCRQDSAITSYTEAIDVLKRYGIDLQFLEADNMEEKHSAISAAADEFIKLVTNAARAKKLDIVIKRPEPFAMEIYTQDNREFDYMNFKLLSKTIAHFAEAELNAQGGIDKAILLGKVNLALGVQLSAYNVDFIHMSGISCKTSGLKTLEKCAKARDDENLMGAVLEMRQECEKEFEIVKNMPPTLPSFWDFFRHCMKSKSEVYKEDNEANRNSVEQKTDKQK